MEGGHRTFQFGSSGQIFKLRLRFQISGRRLVYWKHILSVHKSELIFRVYLAQKLSPVQGDWISLVEKDKELYDIKLSDEEVRIMSKHKFKTYIKQKSEELTLKYLSNLQQKHSKSKRLDMNDLTISQYLLDSRFSKAERELLFRLRSKTVDVKENFKHAYQNNDMLCQLCKLFSCTQAHVLQCPKLITRILVDTKIQLSESFVYGNVDQQLLYVKIFKEFWDLRAKLLEEIKNERTLVTNVTPVAPEIDDQFSVLQ